MNRINKVVLFLIIGLALMACGSDRAANYAENNRSSGVLGVVYNDSDKDGISDGDEINIYFTDPDNNDTDGDGLLDGEEISIYDTNVSNPDTDGDGLLDGDEVHHINEPTNPLKKDTDGDGLLDGLEVNGYLTYNISADDLNASNPDTDGDCLLDSFEILNYGTNVNNIDTDADKVNDGIEIYSYGLDLNESCKESPETLAGGFNANPAKDGIPNINSDVINALDPTNDSDGDGQSNSKEGNCTEGNPFDATKTCPTIVEEYIGKILEEYGYAYIPGGFDVDGDGQNEGGFWMSRYQARSTGIQIPSELVIETIGNVNQYVSRHFKVLNRNVQVLSYSESSLKETGVVAGNELLFDEESIAGIARISNFTPYLANVCLSKYTLADKNNTKLDINITMPTLKQYMHVKMLLDADNVNGGDGRHIRNGLLGIDPNVPLFTYTLVIDEFGESHKEYVRNLVQLRDTFGVDTFDFLSDVPSWWGADVAKFKVFKLGSNSTQDLGNGIGPEKDAYAVIVRGGEVLDVTEGISGALTDDSGVTNGISFRAATEYLY